MNIECLAYDASISYGVDIDNGKKLKLDFLFINVNWMLPMNEWNDHDMT